MVLSFKRGLSFPLSNQFWVTSLPAWAAMYLVGRAGVVERPFFPMLTDWIGVAAGDSISCLDRTTMN